MQQPANAMHADRCPIACLARLGVLARHESIMDPLA